MKCLPILAVLLLGPYCAARSDTASLRYYEGDPPVGKFALLSITRSQWVRLQTAAPKGLRRPPKCASTKPLYGMAVLGSVGKVPFIVLDEPKGTGTGYDALYIDANVNGDFTDDVLPARPKGPGYALEQPFWVQVPIHGCRVPYYAAIVRRPRNSSAKDHDPNRPVVNRGDSGGVYHLESRGYTQGKALFGKKWHRVALIDGNTNGRFRDFDIAAVFSQDRLLVDMNDNGVFDGPSRDQFSYTQGAEILYCGKRAFIDGQCFDIAVAPDGRSLSVSPTKAKLGLLKCDTQALHLALGTADSILLLDMTNGQARIPVGTYKVMVWALKRRDKLNLDWRIFGGKWGPFTLRRTVTVTEKKPGTFDLGGMPLEAWLWARPGHKGLTPGSVSFDILVHTPTCHMVEGMYHVADRGAAAAGRRPPMQDPVARRYFRPTPTITITDARGAGITKVRCRARGDGYLWCGDWTPRASLKGKKLKATATFDNWPFPVKPVSCSFVAK